MENIKIDEIKKKENIREDYGDLTELTESIRECGVRNPIELNTQNEIIDGHRRMVAAKAAGLEEVPCFYTDYKIDEKTSQMIAGIFQKNLNPVEEGKAFQQYIEAEEITIDELAVRISKRKNYVEKRLEIAKLPRKVQTALIKNKIQIGHALLLARVPGEVRDELLKEIIDEELGVQEAKDNMSSQSMNLKDAPFCKGDCKNCIHNGSKQAELFETGAILSGECMNSKCFNKKLREFVDAKKKEYADVLFERKSEYNGNEKPEGYVDSSYTWEMRENKITEAYMKKCRESREGYLVRINENGKITEYFKKRPQKTESGEEIEESEEPKIEKREAALLSKVTEFKTEFLKAKTKETMEPSKFNTKQLAVIRMMQNAEYSALDESAEKFKDVLDTYGRINIKKLLQASDELLDLAMYELSKHALWQMGIKELVLVSRNFGVDVKKDFIITEDYLKMYTKDQLDELIVELTLDHYDGSLKKAQIIEHILQQNIEGLVPKVML